MSTNTSSRMRAFKYFLFVCIGITFIACSEQKPDQNLQKAFDIHIESLEIRKSAGEKLMMLRENSDSTFVSTYRGSLDSLENLLEDWDSELVEVHGFEEAHDHSDHDHGHHDHSHDEHMEDLNLTPDEHLEIQQHLMDEIKGLQKSIDQIQN